jgi:cytochrome c peroxidase
LLPGIGLILAVIAPAVAGAGADPAGGPPLRSRTRQPGALAVSSVDGRERLLAACRKSGSVSLIDPAARRVLSEHDVGQQLADLAALPGGRRFLAVDQAGDELLVVELHGDALRVVARVRVSPDPVRVSASADGLACVVASRWSRRLTFLELTGPRAGEKVAAKVVGTLELPFFPRELARSPDGAALAVGDAFGGRLALVDLERRSLRRVLTLTGHNLRGLASGPDGTALLVALQSLSPLARTTFDDVHWGNLVGNQLRTLSWSALLHGAAGSAAGGGECELGDVGRGAADPSSLIVDRQGRAIVALGGVGELAIVDGPGARPRRIAVGRRPVALAIGTDGRTLYAADASENAISVVDLDQGRRVAAIPLGPWPDQGLVERGERLFHDARLSHDGWMSCQSCHTDGHTSGLLADTLGDGSFGAPKRIPSLLGVGSTGPWNWTGSSDRLEDQVRKSILTTMQGPRTRPASLDADVAALAAYLRSLEPVPSSRIDGAMAHAEGPAASRGRAVFEARRCGECHAPPEYTSPRLYDVGLADELGNRRFNPPSLRGVRLREPLLHDGRAGALEDLFTRHKHPDGVPLPLEATADLIAFLRTL